MGELHPEDEEDTNHVPECVTHLHPTPGIHKDDTKEGRNDVDKVEEEQTECRDIISISPIFQRFMEYGYIQTSISTHKSEYMSMGFNSASTAKLSGTPCDDCTSNIINAKDFLEINVDDFNTSNLCPNNLSYDDSLMDEVQNMEGNLNSMTELDIPFQPGEDISFQLGEVVSFNMCGQREHSFMPNDSDVVDGGGDDRSGGHL